MGLFRNLLDELKGGQQAIKLWDETKDYRSYWDDISEKSSQQSINIKSTSERYHGKNPTEDELRKLGVDPSRLGKFDPYEGFSGIPSRSEMRWGPNIKSVGVWGASGGTLKDNLERKLFSKTEGTNLRGDYIKSTPNYFQDIVQTPGGPIEFSQMGRGPGSEMYLSVPGQGSAQYRRGLFGIPLGKRTY